MSKQYARIPGLMDESPISFYPYLAKVLGVNEAIVLQQIWFWINSNRNKKSTYHFREGKWWVYNSYKQWCEDEFIWLKPRGLQGIILNLESKGILLSMQGVPNKHDRRKWYSIDLKVLEDLLEASLGHSAENAPYSADDALSIDDSMHHVDVHEMYDEYTEKEKDTEKRTERKETTLSANADSAVFPLNDSDLSFEADDPAMFVPKGKKEMSARAENGANRLSKDTATTSPSPSPLPAADVKSAQTFSAALDENAQVPADKVNLAVALGEAWGIAPANGDFGLYMRKAKELLKDIPIEEFKAYCDWRRKQAGDFASKITIATLTGNGHVSMYLAQRSKKIEEDRKRKEMEERLYEKYPEARPRDPQTIEYASRDEVQRLMDMVLNPPNRQENVS